MSDQSGYPDLPPGANERMTERLQKRIAQGARARTRRNRAFLATGAILVAGAATIAAVVLATPTERARSVYCYQGQSLGSPYVEGGRPDQITAPGSHPTEAPSTSTGSKALSAIDSCDAAWQAGLLPINLGPEWSKVPVWTACVRGDQVVAVFPRSAGGATDEEFCDELGLALAP